MRLALLVFVLLLCPQQQEKYDAKKVDDLLRKYFKARPQERAAILKALEPYDAVPLGEVGKLTKKIHNWLRQGSKCTKKNGLCNVGDPKEKGTYLLSGVRGRKQPLVIALHG